MSKDYYSIAGARKNQNAFFRLELAHTEMEFSATGVKGKDKEHQEDALGLAAVPITNAEEFFKKQFSSMIKVNEEDRAGTTGSMYYFDPHKKTITTANLGDSRIYLTIESPAEGRVNKFTTILLTQDHDLDLMRVRKHVVQNKGVISEKGRLQNINLQRSLNMGAAIGDGGYPSLLRDPDIATFKIEDLLLSAGIDPKELPNCKFNIINACDGLNHPQKGANYDYWVNFEENNSSKYTIEMEFPLNPENYLSKIIADNPKHSASSARLSTHLVDNAFKQDEKCGFKSDNISVSTFSFKGSIFDADKKPETGVMGVLFDGHGGNGVALNCVRHMAKEVDLLIKAPSSEPEQSCAESFCPIDCLTQ